MLTGAVAVTEYPNDISGSRRLWRRYQHAALCRGPGASPAQRQGDRPAAVEGGARRTGLHGKGCGWVDSGRPLIWREGCEPGSGRGRLCRIGPPELSATPTRTSGGPADGALAEDQVPGTAALGRC